MSLAQLRYDLAKAAGFHPEEKKQGNCIACKEQFSENNTHTELGWREVRISGLCEDCYDSITANADIYNSIIADTDIPEGCTERCNGLTGDEEFHHHY